MEQYFIPLGTKFVSNIPRHLIDNSQTPYVKNCTLSQGVVKKRFGLNLLYDFGSGDIRGYFRVDDDTFLIAYDNGTNSKIYKCYFDTATSVFKADECKKPGDIAVNFISGVNFHFCKHYDSQVGWVVIITNGTDEIYTFEIGQSTAIIKGLSSDWGGDDERGAFVKSFYGALYIAYTFDGISTYNPYEIVWSNPDDCLTYDAINFENRPEEGTPITGLFTFNDQLILSKLDQLWQIFPYASFKRINTRQGINAENGTVSSDDFFYTYQGKVYSFNGGWLSYPVHNMFASRAAGNWDNIWAAEDTYSEKIMFSTQKWIFIYDKIQDAWTMDEYPDNTKILGDMPPYTRFAYQWGVDLASEYSTERVAAEEDIIPDVLMECDRGKLCRRKHLFDDFGNDIEMYYDTPWISCDAPYNYKWFNKLSMQGIGANFTIYYDIAHSPRMPNFNKYKTLVLNNNFGEVDLSEFGRFITFRIKEKSKNDAQIVSLKLEFERREPR